jgi:hypothetical protein
MGTVDIDQRYMDGPLKGQCVPDDVWSLEQLELLGAARRHSRRVWDEDDEADISIDLRGGTVEFGDDAA